MNRTRQSVFLEIDIFNYFVGMVEISRGSSESHSTSVIYRVNSVLIVTTFQQLGFTEGIVGMEQFRVSKVYKEVFFCKNIFAS